MQAERQPADRVEAWRADLAFLARELKARHVAPFRCVSRVAFEESVAALHERIPELDDAAVAIELARLAASIGDAHTGIWLGAGVAGLRRGPLWLVAFGDGVFVKGVARDLGVDVLNRELLRVGDLSVAEALARVAPLLPRDNETAITRAGPALLNLPRVLHAVGLSDAPDSALYTFAATGAEGEIVLRCRVLEPDTPVVFGVRYAVGSAGAPPAERLRSKAYGFERLGSDAMLQYSACRDEPPESFRSFCRRVFLELDREPPRRLVVDLRWNGGGDSAVTDALLRELRRRPDLTRADVLRVLIGSGTQSSGMWAAVDLAREFEALLVGGPTGGAPNAPGEVGRIVLPHSGLTCTYARRLWTKGGERYPGPALLPDVPVAETSEQHFAGRDVVLEAALAE